MRRYPYTTLLLFSILLAVSVYGMTWFSGLQSGQDTQAGSHTEMSGEDLSLTESSHEMTEVDGADGNQMASRWKSLPQKQQVMVMPMMA